MTCSSRTPLPRGRWVLIVGLPLVIAAMTGPVAVPSPGSLPPTKTSSQEGLARWHLQQLPSAAGGVRSRVMPGRVAAGSDGVAGLALASDVWPRYGQAALLLSGQSKVHTSPDQYAAPIASVAKLMTAYLVLRDHPLALGQSGPTITLTRADVADTTLRRDLGESVVSVVAGERLTERQALQALLLPSANNIAVVLARWDAGSEDHFVAKMNATAGALGMTSTSYTDPSGFDDTTVSTAADQVSIIERTMDMPAFASIVAEPSASLPVVGTVRNTDTLLGHDGFVAGKTGSDNAAGGCFAFRAIRTIDGTPTTITGVVLGQPGAHQITAGLSAADAMVDRIGGHQGAPAGQRQPPRRLPPAEPWPSHSHHNAASGETT